MLDLLPFLILIAAVIVGFVLVAIGNMAGIAIMFLGLPAMLFCDLAFEIFGVYQ